MRILVLAPALYDTSPGQRFRIEQWARYLEKDGFEFAFAPFEDKALHRVIYQPGHVARKARLMLRAFARRLRLVRRPDRYDAVFLFREAALAGPPLIETLLARKGPPIVFDFDDAIWVPYSSPANGRLASLKCFSKTETICRMSRHVTVGNPYLADYARRHNHRVTIVPTTIDTEVYRVKRPRHQDDGRPLTIGWTGSYSTVHHLDTLREVLQELARRHPYRLRVIGTPEYRLEGVETAASPWRAESEVEELQHFDVGIMPLPDDDWSRGKCGLKLLQCMAVGVPAVGSPVGVNCQIIQDGTNGLLAGSPQQWLDGLTRLLRDPALRQRLGAAGRRTVEDRYSARVWAPKVGRILESVAGVEPNRPTRRAPRPSPRVPVSRPRTSTMT